MSIFSSIFKKKPKWIPEYNEGSEFNCHADCFSSPGVSILKCKVLERDKNTWQNYYRVSTKDFLDHNKEPMEFYVHESKIIK